MPFLSKMMSLWRNLFRRKQVEQDLDDELQSYVEEMAARGAGLTESGDIDRIKDLVRQQRVGFSDLRGTGVIVVVAIVTFVSGASAAVGAIRWTTPIQAPDPSLADAHKTTMPQEPRVTLKGRIVDKETGEPIPYAEVGLRPYPTNRRWTATDSDGRFSFFGPPAQGYTLEAGEQKWGVSGLFPIGGADPPKPMNWFYLSDSNRLVVKDTQGQPAEGKRGVVLGVVMWDKRTLKTKHHVIEYREYRYDSSIIELAADKSIGFDKAKVVRFSSTRSH